MFYEMLTGSFVPVPVTSPFFRSSLPAPSLDDGDDSDRVIRSPNSVGARQCRARTSAGSWVVLLLTLASHQVVLDVKSEATVVR